MSGIGSFIDGVFEGMDWREGRDARKRLRKIEDEKLGWDREDRDWLREDRKYTISERRREMQKRDEEEAFWKQMAEEMYPSGAAPEATPSTPSVAPSAPPASSGPATPQMPSEPVPAAPSVPAQPAVTPPAPQAAPAPDPMPAMQAPGPLRAEAVARGAPPEIVDIADKGDRANAALADPGATPNTKAAAARVSQKASETLSAFFRQAITPSSRVAPVEDPAAGFRPAPTGPNVVDPGLLQAGPAADVYSRGPTPRVDPRPGVPAVPTAGAGAHAMREESRLRSAMERMQAVQDKGAWDARNGGRFDPATGLPVGISDGAPSVQSQAPAQPAIPSIADPGIALPAPVDGAADRTDIRNTPVMLPGDGPYSPRSVAESRAREAKGRAVARDRTFSAQPVGQLAAPEGARQTPTTEQGTPKASVEVVKDTTPRPKRNPRSITGEGKPVKTTDAQSERAASAFLKAYDADSVAKVEKFYIARGQPEKAEAFGKWVKDKQVREGMGHWARAVHAASVGDNDRFVAAIAAAYNSSGYFDDGYQIVPDASGLTRDPATGANTRPLVTFKDASGQVFTKTFDGADGLYRLGIQMLSPEQVFEYGWSRVEAADAARAEADKEALKARQITPKMILDAMKAMSEASTPFSLLPVEEQRRLAEAFLRGDTEAAPAGEDDLPVQRRPGG